jgi:hypothetical protein
VNSDKKIYEVPSLPEAIAKPATAWTFRCGGEICVTLDKVYAEKWEKQGFILTPLFAGSAQEPVLSNALAPVITVNSFVSREQYVLELRFELQDELIAAHVAIQHNPSRMLK